MSWEKDWKQLLPLPPPRSRHHVRMAGGGTDCPWEGVCVWEWGRQLPLGPFPLPAVGYSEQNLLIPAQEHVCIT